MSIKQISVRGARQHNLKNIDVDIPRDQFVVITGLSGSGKSSLAFDTIYAEGQRRYVESLSAYARQFLDQLEKPDVDSVEGLSPAISIEQKTVSRSPRSTVGTVTEIYDFLRLLFSSIGQPHCHQCDAPITRQSVDQIVAGVNELEEGQRVMILAPLVRGRKGEFKKELEKLHKDGFVRARIDGELRQLDEEIILDKRKNHTIEVVVDRLLMKEGVRERLAESVKTALKLTNGAVLISIIDGEEKLYSEKMACVNCGINIATLEPRSFSFNSNFGACKRCQGIGTVMEIDAGKIVTDDTATAEKIEFLGGADKSGSSFLRSALVAIIEKFTGGDKLEPPKEGLLAKAKTWAVAKKRGRKKADDIDAGADDLLKTPFKDLPQEIRDAFFHGTKRKITFRHGDYKFEREWRGALRAMRERIENPPSEKIKLALEELIAPVPCPVCHGQRLQPESLAVKVAGLGIADYTDMPIAESAKKFAAIKLSPRDEKIAGLVLKEINGRVGFLDAVGLGYLTLGRSSATLSGGEGQRIRLATQIGSQLRGVLYVLDEPSIGLHPRDNKRLLDTLHQLRDLGNTVLVVEHDQETIEHADYVVDLGPLAGTHGGEVIAAGKPKEIEANPNSLTGKYMSGELKIDVPDVRRLANGKRIKVNGARAYNLKNIDAEFPLGLLTVVTGVSGSGKSTLVEEILYPALYKHVYKSAVEPLAHDSIEGLDLVDKIIEIDQKPIGRTPRSNPATFTGLFTPLRELYAMLPESRTRGYKSGRFSFNVKGGRCEACEGGGMKRIEMNFLPDVYVTCDVCRGHRYNRETLAVKFKGLSIADLLDTTIEDALPLLENIPSIKKILETLLDVGLGYIKIGQSSTTLSGGEAQRIKLAKELSKRATGKTIYILDEPTTGLHFADVHKLLDVLQKLVDTGNTVIVIEHNLDVIKSADYIIDLGPEGGSGGGRVVATGTPEEVAKVKKSYTGQALKAILN
ncbi:MAG: excinuclease ABC subunit UvrA [Acidobacteria bacterium]|nr:excinuclease ABC subunit UvrA [Acidobacteriota bacterium]MBP7473678.1 excinuclease ABC subunit UvrA [Pyrinomonadaceae bacterium]MBP9109426.1 excinuclease ABC subunit UvrA [Pyrinomonadaceae bacterium]